MTVFTGATVEEAISKGLHELNLNNSQVTTTVKTTPRRGFLGFGARIAEVDVTPIEEELHPDAPSIQPQDQPSHTSAETAAPVVAPPAATDAEPEAPRVDYSEVAHRLSDYLLTITQQLGIDATAKVAVHHREVQINFDTEQEGLLIGKHGRTINSLQALGQVYLNHARFSKLSVMLDVASYRERRLETLTRLAENMAREVVATGKPVYLDPMPSFERKQIHNVLAENDYVMTYSAGTEPKRAVVITPR
ncbi:RNA-binding protein [Secundilactobacillus kimchicus JCM 15530]|uniref:RNA-binding protein KhpB n=2 Tax=Secundilactobacillus kimchicus TaxID=528209 RepID=A0A0R1HZV6_9LACO|nr:RNA-binding cell elongation regulator Jag/EloR [Secundilactobacillus kimchicus]KRK48535.1 RNA-binding protein [Secundilactobacillus kimchicus JCM 15530]